MERSKLEQFLVQEYFHLQTVIEAFDSKALTIKAWSVTFSLTSITAAYVAKAPYLLILASISSLLFWLLESIWKTFQNAYYERSEQIEEFFRDDRKNIQPMQIGVSWYEHWKKGGRKRLFRIMRWPHVAMPHFVVFLLGLILLALHLSQLIEVN